MRRFDPRHRAYAHLTLLTVDAFARLLGRRDRLELFARVFLTTPGDRCWFASYWRDLCRGQLWFRVMERLAVEVSRVPTVTKRSRFFRVRQVILRWGDRVVPQNKSIRASMVSVTDTRWGAHLVYSGLLEEWPLCTSFLLTAEAKTKADQMSLFLHALMGTPANVQTFARYWWSMVQGATLVDVIKKINQDFEPAIKKLVKVLERAINDLDTDLELVPFLSRLQQHTIKLEVMGHNTRPLVKKAWQRYSEQSEEVVTGNFAHLCQLLELSEEEPNLFGRVFHQSRVAGSFDSEPDNDDDDDDWSSDESVASSDFDTASEVSEAVQKSDPKEDDPKEDKSESGNPDPEPDSALTASQLIPGPET